MKNILIPTTFEPDTVLAMIRSSDFRIEEEVQIILLSVGAVPDSITELLFPSSWIKVDEDKRSAVLTNWRKHCSAADTPCSKIVEHHQQGMSRPVLRQLLERYDVDMVIVPYSFQQSRDHNHRTLLSFLAHSRIRVMMLPGDPGNVNESLASVVYQY